MGNLVATPQWVDVPYFEANAVLTGGPDCPDNIPIQALLDRTEYLKGSPEFSGTPKAPTAPVDTNTPQLATTAFVQAAQSAGLGSTSPLMDGTAAAGTATKSAREDHRHPTDTTRAPLSSPAFTGTPTAPTAAPGTNTKQIANTEFVMAALGDAISAGAVLGFAMAAAPTGWLKCNGAAVSRTAYEKLFAAIGTTFGAGDGSTTFNVPDMRGEFQRGWDDGRGIDSGRMLGTWQSDDFKSHKHTTYYADNPSVGAYPNGYEASGKRGPSATSDMDNAWPYTSNTGGTETRPRNVALLYCIKY